MNRMLSKLSGVLARRDPRALPELESVLPALPDYRDYARVSVDETDDGRVQVSLKLRRYEVWELNRSDFSKPAWQTTDDWNYAFSWRYGKWELADSQTFDAEDVAAVSAIMSDWEGRAERLGGVQARTQQAYAATRVVGRWLTERMLLDTQPLLQGRPGIDYPEIVVHTGANFNLGWISAGVHCNGGTVFDARRFAGEPWAQLTGEQRTMENLLAAARRYAHAAGELLLEADRAWFEQRTQEQAQQAESAHRQTLARQTVKAARAAAAKN